MAMEPTNSLALTQSRWNMHGNMNIPKPRPWTPRINPAVLSKMKVMGRKVCDSPEQARCVVQWGKRKGWKMVQRRELGKVHVWRLP